jgi:hypothetical protein
VPGHPIDEKENMATFLLHCPASAPMRQIG